MQRSTNIVNSPSIYSSKLKDYSVLIGLWLIVTLFNLFKAYHIDDAFHLEAAQWIMNHWSEPLSGYINWDNNAEVMHSFNQPVLFFYLIAIVGSVFSFEEVPMHLLVSVFSFLALLYFNKCQKALYPNSGYIPLILFALCPAFIVNQNVMTDVPLVALMLGFLYHLIVASTQNQWANYTKAALFLSACLMIKYTVLPLFIVFCIALLLRRHFKQAVTLFIPIGILLLWSWWNMVEFDGVHLLNRSTNTLTAKSFGNGLLAFFGCMAAILPWYILLLLGSWKSKYRSAIMILVISNTLTLGLLVISNFISVKTTDGILNISFTLLGMAVVIHMLYTVIAQVKEKGIKQYCQHQHFHLVLSMVGLALFVILFAPFMATRHVLLVVPFILLLIVPALLKLNSGTKALILGCSVLIGVLLGYSDWQYAQFYKTAAKKAALSAGESKLWSVGHWGWQWYSVNEGAEIYNTNANAVRKGDFMAMPLNITKQDLHPSLTLEAVDSIYTQASAFTFVSVANHGSMYTSRFKKPAWNFSKSPVDTVVVYTITDVNLLK